MKYGKTYYHKYISLHLAFSSKTIQNASKHGNLFQAIATQPVVDIYVLKRSNSTFKAEFIMPPQVVMLNYS